MNPFAEIHRAAVLILDFYEASGFRAGGSVEHDVHKHDFIIHVGPRLECGATRLGCRITFSVALWRDIGPLSAGVAAGCNSALWKDKAERVLRDRRK
jgi:hypothetical protein